MNEGKQKGDFCDAFFVYFFMVCILKVLFSLLNGNCLKLYGLFISNCFYFWIFPISKVPFSSFTFLQVYFLNILKI